MILQIQFIRLSKYVLKFHSYFFNSTLSYRKLNTFRLRRNFLKNIFSWFFQVLSDQQNYEKADSYYDRAMKVDPSNANILVHRGLIQLQWKGDVAKAIEFLERAIR